MVLLPEIWQFLSSLSFHSSVSLWPHPAWPLSLLLGTQVYQLFRWSRFLLLEEQIQELKIQDNLGFAEAHPITSSSCLRPCCCVHATAVTHLNPWLLHHCDRRLTFSCPHQASGTGSSQPPTPTHACTSNISSCHFIVWQMDVTQTLYTRPLYYARNHFDCNSHPTVTASKTDNTATSSTYISQQHPHPTVPLLTPIPLPLYTSRTA